MFNFHSAFPKAVDDEEFGRLRSKRSPLHVPCYQQNYYSYHSFWMTPHATACEEKDDPVDKDDAAFHRNRSRRSYTALQSQISPNNPYKEQIIEMRRELEEPCEACMYTGVSVCLGLSLYFVKLATDDTTLPKNRRFLWVCSAGSIAAGAYRWYLG